MLTFVIKKIGLYQTKLQTKLNLKNFVCNGNAFSCDGKLHDIEVIGKCISSEIKIAKGALIENTILIISGENHRLFIGEDVVMKGGIISIEGASNVIHICKNTTIEEALIAATEDNSKIAIGYDCMLSDKIEIRNGDSHSILINGQRINQGGDIVIGDHVWIGTDAMILKDVTIGNNAIVGAKSLVTKSVTENTLVGGIPAKIIKNGVNWDRSLL